MAVIAFAGITITWSMNRFRLMLENLKVPDQISPEEGLDYFQAMIAQKISSIKSQSDFCVAAICSSEMGPDELSSLLRQHQRVETDGVIRVNDWVGVLISGETEGLDSAFARWRNEFGIDLQGGAALYPDFARTSSELIAAAEGALRQAPAGQDLVWAQVEGEESEPAEDASEEEDDFRDASLDPLTGVLAVHKVAAYMRKFVGEYRRKHSLALFFIGINGMADIEELHGKEAADAVRKGVSDLIQNALRENDVIGRYDENEFLALLICDEPHVAGIGKRLRDRSQKLVIPFNNRRIKVTVNIGGSMCPRHGRSLAALFNAAKGAFDVAQRRQGSMSLIAGEE